MDAARVIPYLHNVEPIAGVEPTLISMEEYREYQYPDGKVLRLYNPVLLYIMKNGSHRVITDDGMVYRPTPGFLAIAWKPRGDVAFVA